MRTDSTTLQDISIFHPDEKDSLFHLLDFTRTEGGREELRRLFRNPHNSISSIQSTQQLLLALSAQLEQWPQEITNGTMLVVDKLMDYPLDPIDQHPLSLNNFFYRWLHAGDYSMLRFSVKHLGDLCRGLEKIAALVKQLEDMEGLRYLLKRLQVLLEKEPIKRIASKDPLEAFSQKETLYYGRELRGPHKNDVLELMQIYHRFDAWYSMATAMVKFKCQLPEWVDSDKPVFDATGLYHLMVPTPVTYNLTLDEQHHFLFLTGANMAGKSTLI